MSTSIRPVRSETIQEYAEAIRRIRAGVLIISAVQILNVAADFAAKPEFAGRFSPVHGLMVALLLGAFALTWTVWFARHWKLIAWLLCTVVLATGTLMSVVSHDVIPRFISVLVFSLGCAAFLPWGRFWQGLLNLVCVTSFAIDMAFVVQPSRYEVYLWLGLLVVVAMAQFVAGFADTARDSDERLRLLVESVQDYAIFTLDPQGRVASWNSGARRLKGYKPEEIIGQHFSRFFSPEDVASRKPELELKQAAAEGRVEDEGWRIRKDGSRFWGSAVISAIRDKSGALRGFSKVTRDLTERRNAEENRMRLTRTQEVLRVRDEFLTFISHELRTPLTALQLQLERLRQEYGALSSPKPREIFARIDHAFSRMADLIESLLQQSRLQGGRLVVTSGTLDLYALAAEVVEEFRPEAERKRLQLRFAGAGRCSIESDERFIRLILVNLIGNAIKFTDRGGIDISVATGDGQRRVSVRDDGPGIAREDQERIFDPFERLEPIANKHTPGFGLGLALAKRMSLAIGGRIELKSQVGAGSTFTLVVPAEIDTDGGGVLGSGTDPVDRR